MEGPYGKREGRWNSSYPFELFSLLRLHWTSSASKDSYPPNLQMDKLLEGKFIQKSTAEKNPQLKINKYISSISAFWMDKAFWKKKTKIS